jgi:exopolyphosphatase/guanosine-5'-triphosphate,3'-diphosphate pyrophosphatase
VTRLAAIDCGTNSIRLLIADPEPPGPGPFLTLDRRMRITRLGQGVDAAGQLAPEALDRTMAVLREYRQAMDAVGVDAVRMTATSAARDAANRDTFFDRAEEAVGVRPELLSGDEEGRLSFAGATAELDPTDGPFLIVDIGGGSTEFVVGTGHAEGVASVDIGCVRLTEKFLASDPRLPRSCRPACRWSAPISKTWLGTCPRRPTPRPSWVWPARSPPSRPSRSASPPTTATASITSG